MASNAVRMRKILNDEFKKYNSRLAFEIRREILNNFDSGKDVNNKPFAKLKKSTREDRIRNNFPARKPILRRTGKLRNSIEVTPIHKNREIIISSKLEYAQDLNDGTHSGQWGEVSFTPNMESRKFLETPKTLKEGSPKRESIFNLFESNLLNKLNNIINKVVSKT